MDKFAIKSLIRTIGFEPVEGKQDIFCKHYPAFKCGIEIDLNQETITYPQPIVVHDRTTSNFKNDENFVVLECVNRLIEKGYEPSRIELERKFQLGRKHSGRLDINVRDNTGKTYLMIECKTFGAEFDKETKNMVKNGGQLFSYFQQDKNTKILCLYASKIAGNSIEYINRIVECPDTFSEANEIKAVHKIWNGQFSNNGLFENDVSAYDFKPNALKIKDLKSLGQEDSSKIFHGFMEILRHNVISDKPNAFNKIFNLFLCKLQDEKGLEEDEAQLQWFKGKDDPVKFLMRINELYAKGVKDYLGKEIANLTEDEIDEMVSKSASEDIANQIKEAILYKNNEFAFSDVYDKRSFEQNAKIVREIVELLQPFKIRYAHKQQFLGDFFELLLSTGFKQESGQFFTPVPLTRFIINSLPIKEITQEKLNNKEQNFLPYVIDYAMGTGHFITEAMDEIQGIINSRELIPKDKNSQSEISGHSSGEFQFKWAEKYIYGIERDYRLVKTAKVACFLHGDGLANIIHGDGLDSFETSLDYKDLLKSNLTDKDNQVFDILVANPPYSVSAFKNTLPDGDKSFNLFEYLTDQSSEIECLFIERAKQLVKTGGYAAVILPSSILSNGGIYSKAREILLRHFEIYAIAEFGENTFMATKTNTVVLFMKRRDDRLYSTIKTSVSKFMNDFKDVTRNSLENAFSHYAQSVYGIEFDDYIALLKGNEIEHDIFKDYQNATTTNSLKEFIQEREQEKLIFYILNAQVQTVVIKTGGKKSDKRFLGYKFSNRRGSEGITIYKNANGRPAGKLYNPDNRHDPERVSHYIYKNGLGNSPLNIPNELKNHLSYRPLNDLILFNAVECEKTIFLTAEKTFELRKSNYDLVKLEELINDNKIFADKGKTITSDTANVAGDIPVVAGGKTSPYNHDKSNVGVPCFTISASGANAGHIWFHDRPIWASDCTYIHSTDEACILTRYLYELFKFDEERIKQTAKGNAQPHVYLKDLLKFSLPIPPIKIQNDIIKKIDAISINASGILSSEGIKALQMDAERQKRAIMSELWKD